MLWLVRKVNEAILIGDHVRVVVHRVDGDEVTIGVEAPIDIRVDREEIRARIARRPWRRNEW